MTTHPKDIIKYCPRCGSNHFVTHDQGRSFKCEDCSLAYYVNNSAAVAGLILNSKGELLLCRRAFDPEKGKLDLPGGFVEPMETAEEAITREIREEINAKVSKLEYLTSFPNEYVYSGFSVWTLDMAFICELESFEVITPGDDISAVEFILPEQIHMEELYSDSMRKILNFYKAKYS